MSQISRAAFNTAYAAIAGLFADNTTRDISEADMRAMLTDLKDSVLFSLDDALPGPQSVVVSSSPITLTLNKNNLVFFNAAAIGGARTWALSVTGGVVEFTFLFEISGGLYVQTMPSSFIMSDVRWDDGAKTWTPIEQGKYKAKGLYNGTNWFLEISPSTYL